MAADYHDCTKRPVIESNVSISNLLFDSITEQQLTSFPRKPDSGYQGMCVISETKEYVVCQPALA